MKRKVIVIVTLVALMLSGCTSYTYDKQDMVELENRLLETENQLSEQAMLVESISEDLVGLKEENESLKDQLALLDSEKMEAPSEIEKRISTIEVRQLINEQFIENLAEYEIVCGWIEEFSEVEKTIVFDDQEWIDVRDESRIEELGLALEDFPNGFTLFNEDESVKTYQYDQDVVIYLYEETTEWTYMRMTRAEFEIYLELCGPDLIFCDVVLRDGIVVAVIEKYIP